MFELLTRNWWVLILRGVIAVIFGVLAFARPEMTLAALVLLFGTFAFVDGIFAVILALGGWDQQHDRWLLLLQGIVGIGIGVITFRAPAITAIGLLLYIAAWSLAIGVLQVAAAIRLRQAVKREFWLALSGVASILFAAILLWSPAAGALALLWVIASYAILFGVALVVLGFRVHGLYARRTRKAEAT